MLLRKLQPVAYQIHILPGRGNAAVRFSLKTMQDINRIAKSHGIDRAVGIAAPTPNTTAVFRFIAIPYALTARMTCDALMSAVAFTPTLSPIASILSLVTIAATVLPPASSMMTSPLTAPS